MVKPASGFEPKHKICELAGGWKPGAGSALDSLQLRILLHQLLQTEARELYRNLGIFTFSFALVDGAFAIFRMANFLSRAEALSAFGLFDRQFGDAELLASRGEKVGNVLNRVVGLAGVRRRRSALFLLAAPDRTLVFVFVRVVGGFLLVWSRATRPRVPEPGRLALSHTTCAGSSG